MVDIEGAFDLKPYSLVNLKAGWGNEQDDLEIYDFAQNLFDKRYQVYGADFSNVPIVMMGCWASRGDRRHQAFLMEVAARILESPSTAEHERVALRACLDQEPHFHPNALFKGVLFA